MPDGLESPPALADPALLTAEEQRLQEARAGVPWRAWDPLYGDPFFDGLDVHTIDSFEASAEIVTRKGPKPADDVRAFDAHAVVETLRPKIVAPAAK